MSNLAVALFFASTLFAQTGSEQSAGAQLREHPALTVSPKRVARGKDYNVVVRSKDETCVTKKPLSGVEVDLGDVSGFKVEKGLPGDGCFVRFKLSVANDAPLGEVEIPLIRKPDNTSLNPVTLETVAVDQGPIPPGLDPTVDVSWKVLPRRAVSDSFGRRVSQLYFGVELTIGNNSGYDLQVASIGFRPKGLGADRPPLPNDSYAIVRGTLEREQTVGTRALLIDGIRAAGPIVAAASTFYVNPRPRANYSAFAAILNNPFAEGMQLLLPDRTVRQLIALDTRAVRDSAIIPNNIQQRLLLFVSRELVMCEKGYWYKLVKKVCDQASGQTPGLTANLNPNPSRGSSMRWNSIRFRSWSASTSSSL